MNVNIYNVVAAVLEADTSLTAQEKEKILAVCRHPVEFAKPEERKVPKLLNTKAAAKMLGISRCTFWRMTREGQIPAITLRADGRPLYNIDDIQAFLDEQKQKPDRCSE